MDLFCVYARRPRTGRATESLLPRLAPLHSVFALKQMIEPIITIQNQEEKYVTDLTQIMLGIYKRTVKLLM